MADVEKYDMGRCDSNIYENGEFVGILENVYGAEYIEA